MMSDIQVGRQVAFDFTKQAFVVKYLIKVGRLISVRLWNVKDGGS